jgi:hypothetical protein
VSERYQREIEELLKRLDKRPLQEPLSRRVSRRTAGFRAGFASGLRGFLRRTPVEQFMIASGALLLIYLVLGLPFFTPLAGVKYWAGVLSLLFFLLAIGLAIVQRRPSGGSGGPTWRGQVVDYRPRNPDLWWRIRQWFRRRR